MPRSHSSTPDRDDVLTQEGDISVASTSDSGRSEEGSRRIRPSTAAIAPQPVPTTCTMCDVAVSEFICAQCGRLSFCLKCSISLHDNKFLGGHKLTAVHGGVITGLGSIPQESVSVGDLKILLHGRELPPARQVPPPVPSAEIDVAPTVRYAKDAGRAPDEPVASNGPELTEEQLVTLGSDRRLLRARLSEVSRCAELLKGTAAKAAHEKAMASDATKTAIEAVRRRFDVLRQLVDAKEKEYFEVIDAAGKKRLDEAARTATAATVAAAETEAFVKLMVTQLERLDGNNKQFFDCRRQMLEEVALRTKTVDLQVSELERSLEDIHAISLGVPVHLQAAIDAVLVLQPPATLLMHYASTHHESIPADRFHSQPGVQVWAADGSLLSKGDVDSLAAAVPTPRKSLAQQVQELKAMPMPTARTQSPARAVTPSRISPPRAPALSVGVAASPRPPSPVHASQRADAKSSLIAKIAARGANGGAAGSGASIFPSELETLKKHIAQRAVTRQTPIAAPSATTGAPPSAAPSTALQTHTPRYKQPIAVPQPSVIPVTRTASHGRASSPAGSRAQSPVARQPSLVTATATTPSKRAMSPTAAMRIRMGLGADVAAAQPGPGAYFQHPKPFNSRSVLSTPPRRAVG